VQLSTLLNRCLRSIRIHNVIVQQGWKLNSGVFSLPLSPTWADSDCSSSDRSRSAVSPRISYVDGQPHARRQFIRLRMINKPHIRSPVPIALLPRGSRPKDVHLLLSLLLMTVQGSSITLNLSPMPAPAAVRSIAAASGRRLAVVPALSEEILFVRLKDAPVDTALSHIAEVLCAKWIKRANGVSLLEPDPKALRNVEQAEADEKERSLLTSMKYMREHLARQPEVFDQKALNAYKKKKQDRAQGIVDAETRKEGGRTFPVLSGNQGTPAWRAVARIVLRMDPKAILAIPNDGREVWAENPTPTQHAFSEEANEVLKTYRQELNVYDPTLSVNRVKLVFWKNTISPSNLCVKLEASGPDGKIADRTLAPLSGYSQMMAVLNEEGKEAPAKPEETPLKPSPDAIEARMALAVWYDGPDRRAIFAKWRPRILDPVYFEPTTWDLGYELVMAAESLDRNLVGTVNDVLTTSLPVYKNATASQVLKENRESILPSDDGWLVFRSHERQQRASRSRAKSLLANCVQLGGITVDLAANWTAQSTDVFPFMNWVGGNVGLICPYDGEYGSISTMMAPDPLRLWADIGPAGIDSLRQGAALQLSRLSPAAKAQIEEMVYGNELNDGRDPTDVLPNGITDGSLTMSIGESTVFYGWVGAEGPPVTPRLMDAQEFGSVLAKGRPWLDEPARIFQQYNRFRLGLHRKYTLNFRIEPGAIPMTVTLNETLLNPESQDVSELPADLKSAVEKARLAALAPPAETSPIRTIPPR